MTNNNNEHQIDKVMQSAMNNLKELVDVNTVVGTPFTSVDGTVIVPVSKVTMSFLVAGGEYQTTTRIEGENYPMSAGSGGYVQLSPIGFLVGSGKEMKAISVLKEETSYNKLVDATFDFISSKIKNKDEDK